MGENVIRISTVFVSFFVCSVSPWCNHIYGAEPTYWADVRPILRRNCTVCHSARTLKEPDVSGGLALDSFAATLTGAKSPVVVTGKPDVSELLQRLHTTDPAKRMPLDADPLPEETVSLLRRWIAAGAPEGARPSEPEASATDSAFRVAQGSGSEKRRKLDVAFSTKCAPPRTLTPKQPPFNTYLELVLPAGPLTPVTAVAFCPDGSLLATGVYGRVTIWDLRTVTPAKVLTNVLGAVNDLKFSPDGKTLAVAGGQPSARGDLRLFHVADWSLAATFGGHTDVVSSIAFSPDGGRLASAGFDKIVRVWDLATRRTAFVLNGHTDFVYSVAWDPKGEWIASVGKDRTVKVVDAKTGKSRLTLSGTEQEVLAVAASADGKEIISSGGDARLFWWNATTGERTRRMSGHDVAVNQISVSGDGKLVASAGDDVVRLWNGSNGQALRTLPLGSMAYTVTLSPDGKRVAAGSFDGLVRIFDTGSVKPLVTLACADAAEWLALTPEGYLNCSDDWAALGRWRLAKQDLSGIPFWAALRQPAAVAKIAAGEKVSEPSFKK